jgi:hypothetical protein
MGGVKNVSTAGEYADALRSSALVQAPGALLQRTPFAVFGCVFGCAAQGARSAVLCLGRRP